MHITKKYINIQCNPTQGDASLGVLCSRAIIADRVFFILSRLFIAPHSMLLIYAPRLLPSILISPLEANTRCRMCWTMAGRFLNRKCNERGTDGQTLKVGQKSLIAHTHAVVHPIYIDVYTRLYCRIQCLTLSASHVYVH